MVKTLKEELPIEKRRPHTNSAGGGNLNVLSCTKRRTGPYKVSTTILLSSSTRRFPICDQFATILHEEYGVLPSISDLNTTYTTHWKLSRALRNGLRLRTNEIRSQPSPKYYSNLGGGGSGGSCEVIRDHTYNLTLPIVSKSTKIMYLKDIERDIQTIETVSKLLNSRIEGIICLKSKTSKINRDALASAMRSDSALERKKMGHWGVGFYYSTTRTDIKSSVLQGSRSRLSHNQEYFENCEQVKNLVGQFVQESNPSMNCVLALKMEYIPPIRIQTTETEQRKRQTNIATTCGSYREGSITIQQSRIDEENDLLDSV